MDRQQARARVRRRHRWRGGRVEGERLRVEVEGEVLAAAGFEEGDELRLTAIGRGTVLMTLARHAGEPSEERGIDYAARWAHRRARAARLGLRPFRWRQEAAALTAAKPAARKR